MKKLFTLLSLLPATLFAQTFSESVQTAIPNTQSDLLIPITVSGLPTSIDASFGLATVCIDITHQHMSDLKVRLRSPQGTEVVLTDQRGGSGTGYHQVCFQEDATSGYITSALNPSYGTFVPQYSLNTFNTGLNPNGTWNLVITDMFNFLDSGYFHAVTIDFRTNPPVDPASLVLCTTSNAGGCQCPGGATECDLLPDLTHSCTNWANPITETPGYLQVSTATPNIGWGPLEIHGTNNCFCDETQVPCTTVTCPNGMPPQQMVTQTIYHKNDNVMTTWSRPAGTMAYHPSHGHIHVDDWVWIDARRKNGDPNPTHWPKTGQGSKTSYCLVNLGNCDNPGVCRDNDGNTLLQADIPNASMGSVSGCTQNQGIYVGEYDTYGSILVNLPSSTCNGQYYIVSITDPTNAMLEQDETNNWTVIPFTLTHQLGVGTFEPEGFLWQLSSLQVSCLSNSFAADSISWDWGDGSQRTLYTGSPANPVSDHTYPGPGTYVIGQSVYNRCGLTYSQDTLRILATNVTDLSKALVFHNVYPNPAKDRISIDYTLSNNTDVKIEIMDAVGHLVKEMTNANQTIGKYHVSLDLNSEQIRQGIYFVRIAAGDKIVNERFAVVK